MDNEEFEPRKEKLISTDLKDSKKKNINHTSNYNFETDNDSFVTFISQTPEFIIVKKEDVNQNSDESLIDITVKYISNYTYSLWNTLSESVASNFN
jgi:hypothetical protein